MDSTCSEFTIFVYNYTYLFLLTYLRMFLERKYEYFYGQELFMQICIFINVYTINIFQGLFLFINVQWEIRTQSPSERTNTWNNYSSKEFKKIIMHLHEILSESLSLKKNSENKKSCRLLPKTEDCSGYTY